MIHINSKARLVSILKDRQQRRVANRKVRIHRNNRLVEKGFGGWKTVFESKQLETKLELMGSLYRRKVLLARSFDNLRPSEINFKHSQKIF